MKSCMFHSRRSCKPRIFVPQTVTVRQRSLSQAHTISESVASRRALYAFVIGIENCGCDDTVGIINVDSESVGTGRTLRLFRDFTTALSVHMMQEGTRPYRKTARDEYTDSERSAHTHVRRKD